MKLGEVKQSSETGQRKLYTGLATLEVVCVNPDKNEVKEKLGWNLEEEPVYTGEKDDVEYVSIIIYTKISGQDDIIPLRFYLRNEPRTNKDQTKAQVVNVYGESCWLTQEQFEKEEIPSNINFSPEGMRSAYAGEVPLLEFVRTFLNVPSRMAYNRNTKEWYEIDNPDIAMAQFENPEAFFKGDVKEVEDCLALFPENKIKVWLGVQTGDNNKHYQTFFPDRFMKLSASSADSIKNAITNAKNAGMYGNVEFGKEQLEEYTDKPTEIEPQKAVSKEEIKSKWLPKK